MNNIKEYIKKLKKYEPIYVIGHSNIDIDSAISSKIFSEILNYFDINSSYVILEKNYSFDEYNKRMLNDCTNFNPKVILNEEISKYNFFLVDHNDYLQSVGSNANIVGCIDHHPNSKKIQNTIITDCCATSLYIYHAFKDIYTFTREQKFEIFMAFLNDSTFGKSSRFKESDRIIASELGFSMELDDWFKKYFMPTNLSNGIKSCIYNGHKKYEFNNATFESGYIEAFGTKGLDEYEKIINNLSDFLGIWIDYNVPKTYVFFNYKENFIKWKYNFVASRATTILKDTMKIINQK